MTGINQALLADIGGTNARFALVRDGGLGPIEHVKVADYPTSADAIRAFLARHAIRGAHTAAIFGIAGPIARGCSMRPVCASNSLSRPCTC
jgi:glucokinase